MRKFSSYGSIDPDLHYYVPRQELIDQARLKLIGENPEKGGHYMTVWAPRQRGKTWIMEQVLFALRDTSDYEAFDVVHLPLEDQKLKTNVDDIMQDIAHQILEQLGLDLKLNSKQEALRDIFKRDILTKPLILILDEFDALHPQAISGIVSMFRNIHFRRQQQRHKPSAERDYLLHGVALIGVRAVLGLENKTGSPFNIQHSLHIPNLTYDEVDSMFHWYERESGQQVDQAVIDQIFYETNGQPGLVSWLGELLTVNYNDHKTEPLTLTHLKRVMLWAIDGLGNANIINIISKANQAPYKAVVLDLFKTDQKKKFRYDDAQLNFLYLNGVIDIEEAATTLYVKFPCPFVQKRLFNYFAQEIFQDMGQLYPPLDDLDDIFSPEGLHLQSLFKRYEQYLQQNSTWLFKNAPRRHDMRLYEAVYHFNLYMYLSQFLQRREGSVWPEFPTGNGQIDLMIQYEGQLYGLEVKSFADNYEYKKALKQAADYASQLQLTEITLLLFIEAIDDKNRAKYETIYHDTRGIKVVPVFVVTDS